MPIQPVRLRVFKSSPMSQVFQSPVKQKKVICVVCVLLLVMLGIVVYLKSHTSRTPTTRKETVSDSIPISPSSISPSIPGSAHHVRIFEVRFQSGHLNPNTFEASVGDTVHLSLQTSESAQVLKIPLLNIEQRTDPKKKTVIEFSEQASGTFPIICDSCTIKEPIGTIRFQ